MWSTDVFSRAWLLLWRVALSPSRRVEGSSPQSASLKLRPSPRDMESIWRRSRTPMGRSSANSSIRRNRREDGLPVMSAHLPNERRDLLVASVVLAAIGAVLIVLGPAKQSGNPSSRRLRLILELAQSSRR